MTKEWFILYIFLLKKSSKNVLEAPQVLILIMIMIFLMNWNTIELCLTAGIKEPLGIIFETKTSVKLCKLFQSFINNWANLIEKISKINRRFCHHPLIKIWFRHRILNWTKFGHRTWTAWNLNHQFEGLMAYAYIFPALKNDFFVVVPLWRKQSFLIG